MVTARCKPAQRRPRSGRGAGGLVGLTRQVAATAAAALVFKVLPAARDTPRGSVNVTVVGPRFRAAVTPVSRECISLIGREVAQKRNKTPIFNYFQRHRQALTHLMCR